MNYQKKDVAKMVAAKTNVEKKVVEAVINSTLETIADIMAEGGKANFYGFGCFEAKERKGRKCVNMKTGEEMMSKDKNVPSFKASKTLKDKFVK